MKKLKIGGKPDFLSYNILQLLKFHETFFRLSLGLKN